MAHYLIQVSYTPQAWQAMRSNPQNRLAAVQPLAESLGGIIVFKGFAFGDYDLVAIIDMPTPISAAAFSMAVSAGGAVKAFKTTPLLSIEESISAMSAAGQSAYSPPHK